jgi:arginine utilization protein RocB
MFEEIRELAKQLVAIPSVNTTPGEKTIGEFIENWFRGLPYFQKYPEYVYVRPLKNDPLGRRNVFVLLKGEKNAGAATLIFHGHTDTVGTEDFGLYEKYAFNCDALAEAFREADLPGEARGDLESGDYLFGRGSCDMKSGDAVFMIIAKYLSFRIGELSGNILLSFNPVEENLHTGIIEAGDFFIELAERENLRYLFALNNDYICPLFSGDTRRYVYTGAVGKLLPCFYIQGKETHVGQPFEGFDATMVASDLVQRINLNTEFCDCYNGEYTLPPVVLKSKDLKTQYNVQTPFASFVYFNYMIHDASVPAITEKLKQAARESFNAALDTINKRNKDHCSLSGMHYAPVFYDAEVLSYSELYALAMKKTGGGIAGELRNFTGDLVAKDVDKRDCALEIVRHVCTRAGLKRPLIVLFYAAPYCPHNTLKAAVPAEKSLYDGIAALCNEFAKKSGETFQVMSFFPSLTDSSYIKMDDDPKSIRYLIDNFPEYNALYPVDLEKIKNLNIPGINFGCFGKDAHKWTERVYMPYSYKILPELILETVKKFLR